MTTQTLKLSQIETSGANPRKSFDEESIAGLAQSIKTDGLIQNLVVAKPKGKKKKHPIICGERRFRALTLLQEQGDLPEDYEVSVEIKTGLSDEQILRMATVENVQRENLSSLEEAEAIKALVQDGKKLDDIIAKTGLAVGTIKRRLALINLCDAAKQALSEGELTLSKAEALSIGSLEDQERVLKRAMWENNDAEDVKDMLVGNLPTLSMAIFDVAEYTGDFTRDLLGEEDATYFNDFDQFYELQKQAAEKLVEEHLKTAEWAELVEGYFSSYEYGKAEEGEKGGVIVVLRHNGDVEVKEGLIKTKADQATTDALKKPRATYSVPLVKYMAEHKSIAVQAALLENPRTMKEIIVAEKLAAFGYARHNHVSYFDDEESTPPALQQINDVAKQIYALFAEAQEDTTWRSFYDLRISSADAYDRTKALSEIELEAVQVFLEVLEFGQDFVERLDTNKDSLFNKVALDLNVDMRNYWRPDEAFLKRRNKVQLASIIHDAGCSQKFGNGNGYKKKELVASMAKHFQHVMTLEAPSADELKAQFWLPEAMQFPAINPDAKPEPEIEEVEAFDDLDDEEEYAEAA